jgi:hypothetical protein
MGETCSMNHEIELRNKLKPESLKWQNLERLRHAWDNNIKVDHKELGIEGMKWFRLRFNGRFF